jgi:hypothetical protein
VPVAVLGMAASVDFDRLALGFPGVKTEAGRSKSET